MKTDPPYRSRVAENAVGKLHAPERIVLPMSSGLCIPPGASARITSRPQNYAVRPDRLLIKRAEHWHVNRAEIMRFPWFPAGPAGAFAPGERTALPERRIPCAGDVLLDVTYVGPRKQGEPFEACLFVQPSTTPAVAPPATATPEVPPEHPAHPDHHLPHDHPRHPAHPTHPYHHRYRATGWAPAVGQGKNLLVGEIIPHNLFVDRPGPTGEHRVAPQTSAKIRSDVQVQARVVRPTEPQGRTFCATVQGHIPFWPQRLAITDADQWAVNDLRINGVSLLAQDGDLPGGMFSSGARPTLPPLRFGMLSVDDGLEVTATYLGADPSPVLLCELSGSATAPEPEEDPGCVSTFLPMSSGVKILPNTAAQIMSRPCIPSDGKDDRGMAFQPSQIVIADADDWVVTDVRIGNMSQFSQSGDVPGVAFSAVAAEPVRMSILQVAMDCVICVRYVGAREEGAPFLCGIAGNALRSA